MCGETFGSVQKAGIEGMWAPLELRRTSSRSCPSRASTWTRSPGWPGISASGRPRPIYLHELRTVITTGTDVMDGYAFSRALPYAVYNRISTLSY
jgi:hypothetical protein